MSGLEMTAEDITELFVKDSCFFLSQSNDIQVFLRNRKSELGGNGQTM